MKKILYIIPGWEDACSQASYQKLAKTAEDLGYEVFLKDVDWKKPLSEQIFSVEKGAVVFGFSLGAILAWFVAQQYQIKHLILASMTPHYSFSDVEIKQALIDLAGVRFVDDVIKNLETKHQAEKQTMLYGDKEGELADILVANTEHELNDRYISEIAKII